MALQTPLSQEQLIAQALGAAAQGGMNSGIPGAGGMPAPTGMPGTPQLSPQMLSQALGAAPVNPMMTAATDPSQLFDPGSHADFQVRAKQWRECQARNAMTDNPVDCGPQPQPGDRPQPTGIVGI